MVTLPTLNGNLLQLFYSVLLDSLFSLEGAMLDLKESDSTELKCNLKSQNKELL